VFSVGDRREGFSKWFKCWDPVKKKKSARLLWGETGDRWAERRVKKAV